MNTPVFAYQIYYNEETRTQLDAGFMPLDNMANPRPDWREYWPIRNFFLQHKQLQEDAFYGFLSPKFTEKSGLSAAEVLDFIATYPDPVDVFSFSPYFDQMAMFINIFEQGDAHHSGLLRCMEVFLSQLGQNSALLSSIGHSRNTIYCNYFFAKPAFWRMWMEINEALYAICETNTTELARQLNTGTDHAGSSTCPLKVFLIERTASLMLATGAYRGIAYKPLERPRTNSRVASQDSALLIADALKLAYVTTGEPQYLNAFHNWRQSVIQQLEEPRSSSTM